MNNTPQSNIVSIIIPCFNEKDTIKKIINLIHKNNKFKKEIILVDDFSTDGTREIVKKFTKSFVDKVILHKFNKGKGACIKTASKYLNGEIILIQDADLEYSPSDYDRLLNPIRKNNFKVVYGSRVLNTKRYNSKNFTSKYRIFFNHVLTILSNIINKQNLTDAHTCYKVFKKEIFKKINLKENRFGFCPEITTKVSLLNVKIHEVPIRYNGRSYKNGKKISMLDGLRAIYCLFFYRFFELGFLKKNDKQ
jgi:dolichol-phosphate mannosyltransferase